MNNFGAQNMVSHLKKVLMKEPQNFMSKVNLQKWNYTSPLDQEILYENYNEFYKIIKNSGAEIVNLKLSNENEKNRAKFFFMKFLLGLFLLILLR